MINLIFLILGLCSSTCFSMAEYFSRINQENNTLEVALRTFIRDGHEVDLLGMFHFGELAFYQSVNQQLNNKIVIYELAGCDFEQHQKQNDALHNLPSCYREQHANIRRLYNPYELAAYAFGLCSQNEAFDLSGARRHIHADILAPKSFHAKYDDINILKEYIHEVAINILKNWSVINTDPGQQLDQEVKRRAANLAGLREIIEDDLKASCNAESRKDTYFIKKNPIILDKLRPELGQENLLIIYGAAHLLEVAQFLLEQGYKIKETKWLPVISGL